MDEEFNSSYGVRVDTHRPVKNKIMSAMCSLINQNYIYRIALEEDDAIRKVLQH